MNYSTTTALVLGLAALAASVGCVRGPVAPDKACVFPEREITVDGDVADWSGATWYDVSNAGSQWLGQGITAEGWSGPADLSYRWAGAWDGKGQLYFVFDVTDDCVISPPAQPNSFLNDCVELMIDYNHSGGAPIHGSDRREGVAGLRNAFPANSTAARFCRRQAFADVSHGEAPK